MNEVILSNMLGCQTYCISDSPSNRYCFIGPIECNGKLIEEFRKGIIVKLKHVEKRVLDTFKENINIFYFFSGKDILKTSTSYEPLVTFHIFVKPSYLPEIIWSIYYKIVHIIHILLLPCEIKIPLHNNTVSVIAQVDSVVRKCIQDSFFHVFEFYHYPLLKHFY